MPETIKLFCSKKKINRQNKNGKNVLSLAAVEIGTKSLVHNQYQQKCDVLNTFVPNKSLIEILNRKYITLNLFILL